MLREGYPLCVGSGEALSNISSDDTARNYPNSFDIFYVYLEYFGKGITISTLAI